MQLSDFHYTLPPELIARYPLEKRTASRLLKLGPQGELTHSYFADLSDFISEKDLIVFNNSRVIPARLKGQKASGGRVEILVERILDEQKILVHLRASKTPAPGSFLLFADDTRFKVCGRQQNLFILECEGSFSALSVIERLGEIPLPPYLHRPAEESDKERYQTVYAQDKGSVAAPTAGLHFDETTLEQLKAKGVDLAFLTLHVGAGTFLPVRTENIFEHHMHPEYLQVSPEVCEKVRRTQAQGGRIIAVGTTTARSLETASRSGQIQPYSGDTDLFIYPGYTFHCVDLLITNFHLPESTLLMLVCALGGQEAVMQAYHEAVKEQYRFYSYGDAMLVSKTSLKS
jgi:S-adenosylmethionine:tRNA ribosyltransferase-isomerase